jgi:hypothetical protein
MIRLRNLCLRTAKQFGPELDYGDYSIYASWAREAAEQDWTKREH